MYKLCVIEGDGVGKEVIPEAVKVLKLVMPSLKTFHAQAGWETFQQTGASVPEDTLNTIKDCGAAIFGAVSSPSHSVDGYRSAIISMRQKLDLYSNIRPIRSLPEISPDQDVDMVIVRENTEGMYSGREYRDGDTAIAERVITGKASRKIAKKAVELIKLDNRNKLTIVHKANILPVTDGLFRDSVKETIKNHLEEFTVNELLVDTAAMKIISDPKSLDVLVTTNLFGDILSDEAAYWCGGMGLAPSLNWGDGVALAEPVHGSAPDIAGKGIANPIAAILSAALLVRYLWNMPQISKCIVFAVDAALSSGNIAENGKMISGITTTNITNAIISKL